MRECEYCKGPMPPEAEEVHFCCTECFEANAREAKRQARYKCHLCGSAFWDHTCKPVRT